MAFTGKNLASTCTTVFQGSYILLVSKLCVCVFYLLTFREREREGEREGEEHPPIASHTPQSEDLALDPGMCSD